MVKSVFFNSKFKSKSKNQSSNNQLDDRPAKKHCNSRSKFKNQPDQSETMTTGLVTVNRSAESPDDSSEPPSSPSIVIEDSPQPVNTRQPTRQTATDPTTAVTTNTNRTRSDSSRSQASGSTNQIQTSNNRNQIFNTQLTVYRKKTPLLKSVKRHATILMRAYRIKQILSQPTVLNLPRNILPSDNVLQLSQEIAEKVSLQIFRKEVSKVNLLDHETRMRNKKIDNQSRIFQNSKASLEAPLPEQPSLPNFDRITLRQKELDKSFGRVKPKTRRWRKQLEADKLALVKKVFAQSGKISDLPGAYCGNYDIQKLRPGQWMNDEVATFYGVMINMRSNKLEELKLKKTKNGQKFLKAHCFNSFFINKYDDSGYEGVKRWSKKIDLFKKDVIIFPINIRNSHWTCAAINIKKKRFEFYDSMGNHNDSILAVESLHPKKIILRDYIVNESKTKRNQELDVSDWSNFYHPAVPQQQNGFDCGIFVCQFMDCLSRDWGDGNDTIFDFDQSNMGYIRTKMVYEIATKEFLDEEWK